MRTDKRLGASQVFRGVREGWGDIRGYGQMVGGVGKLAGSAGGLVGSKEGLQD